MICLEFVKIYFGHLLQNKHSHFSTMSKSDKFIRSNRNELYFLEIIDIIQLNFTKGSQPQL